MTTTEKSRAVFSINDPEIIREALLFYVTNANKMEDTKRNAVLQLYHRLGRVDIKSAK
jgi:hypothetical protein